MFLLFKATAMYEKKQVSILISRTMLIVMLLLSLTLGGCGKPKRAARPYKIAPSQLDNSMAGYARPDEQVGWQTASQSPQGHPEEGIQQWDSSQQPALTARGSSTEYHFGPGDVLLIKVFQLLEPDKEAIIKAEVDRTGHIYMPVLNHIYVNELTVEQLQRELIRRLATNYIKDPKVNVAIEQFNSKLVMVMGNVNRTGTLALQTDNTTLLDVISQMNGLRTPTGPEIEILRGAYNPTGSKQTGASMIDATGKKRERVPVSLLFSDNERSRVNPVIYPGDVVNVLPASEGYIYVAGEVKQPGSKDFRRPLTIMQAIAVCGGETKIADEKHCTVIRRGVDGIEREVVINLERIREGKDDNILLAQNDTIYVPVDGWKKFWDDVNNMFRRGVSTGVSFTYDAARDAGVTSAGGAGGY